MGGVDHQDVDPVVAENLVQPIGGQPQNLFDVDRFLDMGIDRMEVFDAVVQIEKPPFEGRFLLGHRPVELIEAARPFQHLLGAPADEKTRGPQHRGGPHPHIQKQGQIFSGAHHALLQLLPESLSILPEEQQPQQLPADRGADAETEAADAEQPAPIDTPHRGFRVHVLPP